MIKSDDTLERRIGRFYIDGLASRSIPGLQAVFAGMVPLVVENDWRRDRRLFVCCSPAFRVVPVGERVPFYVATITQHDEGELSVTWDELTEQAAEVLRWTA